MTNIDRLIFDSLAARRSVVLPGEGTLEVRRRGARKISDTRIVPPQNVVIFIPDEKQGAQNVVTLVMNAAGVDEHAAGEEYLSWLEAARRADDSLAIGEVGEIKGGEFTVAGELHSALNPVDDDVVEMESSRRSTPVWVWLLVGLLAAALVAAGLMCWQKGAGFPWCGKGGEAVVTPSVAVDPSGEAGAASGGALTEGAIAEAEAAMAAAMAAEAASASGVGAGAGGAASGKRFHVIAGAFAIESNADKFMAKIKREHPELTPMKIVNPENGYNMVSIWQAATRGEASSKTNLYWDIDLYLWIYEQR
jgi:hypothetical protein